MSDLYQEIQEFSQGVNSAQAPDRISLNSSPLAINSAFKNIGSGKANIGTRPGLVCLNSTAISGTPATIFMRLYSYDAGSNFSNYLAIVSADGTLRYKETNDTLSSALAPPANFSGTSGQCFVAGDVLVDGTVMNNRLFLVTELSEMRSLLNKTYKPWGLSPVASFTAAGAATGSSSMPDETYSVAITSYDSATGGESAISTSSSVAIGGANRRLKIDISPTAAETATYSHWRVYLQRQTTQADLYKVLVMEDVGGSNIVTDGNIPIGTTTVYVDLSAAQIAALVTVAPSQAQYGRPPSDIKYVSTYGRRLVAASDRNFYWSQIDKPDSFAATAFEPIETGEGDKITGIYPFSAELLIITTSTATWGVFGNDPETWVIRPIDNAVGSASHLSIVDFNGQLGWWAPDRGPVIFDGQQVRSQALDDLGQDFIVHNVEPTTLAKIYGAFDPQGQRVLWTFAPTGTTDRMTRLLPYNTRLNKFEASYWNPMDFGALSVGYIQDGSERIFAGGYEGQIFYFDKDVNNDAAASGTVSFSFTPAASTVGTLTSTGFDTTGAGLAERYVVVTDSNDKFVAKVRISSNNATTLTLANNLTNLSVGSAYNAYIGGPDLRFYTKWLDMDQTFNRKRFDRLYLQAQSAGDASNVKIGTQVDFAEDSQLASTTFSVTGATWDSGVWDSSVWTGTSQLKRRIFIGQTGQSVRVSISHFTPNVDLTIHTIGLLARLQSERYYA